MYGKILEKLQKLHLKVVRGIHQQTLVHGPSELERLAKLLDEIEKELEAIEEMF